jgi:hypothetical protein
VSDAFLVIRQSRIKLVLGLIVCAVGAVAGGFGMVSPGKDSFGIGLLLLVAFGAFTLLYLKQLILPAQLRFTPEGLDARLIVAHRFWPWSAIQEVGLIHQNRVTHVRLKLSDGHWQGLTGAWTAHPQDIATAINTARQHYGAIVTPPPPANANPPIVQ